MPLFGSVSGKRTKKKKKAVLERERERERERGERLSAYLKGVGSLRFRILLGLLSISLPALLLKEL